MIIADASNVQPISDNSLDQSQLYFLLFYLVSSIYLSSFCFSPVANVYLACSSGESVARRQDSLPIVCEQK